MCSKTPTLVALIPQRGRLQPDCLVWQGLGADNIKVWEQNQIGAAEHRVCQREGVFWVKETTSAVPVAVLR